MMYSIHHSADARHGLCCVAEKQVKNRTLCKTRKECGTRLWFSWGSGGGCGSIGQIVSCETSSAPRRLAATRGGITTHDGESARRDRRQKEADNRQTGCNKRFALWARATS